VAAGFAHAEAVGGDVALDHWLRERKGRGWRGEREQEERGWRKGRGVGAETHQNDTANG
jgi:hypothetical protein